MFVRGLVGVVSILYSILVLPSGYMFSIRFCGVYVVCALMIVVFIIIASSSIVCFFNRLSRLFLLVMGVFKF